MAATAVHDRTPTGDLVAHPILGGLHHRYARIQYSETAAAKFREKCRTYSPGENRTGGVGDIGVGVL